MSARPTDRFAGFKRAADTRTLAATYRPVSELPGIDLRPEAQLGLLRDVLALHQEELTALPEAPGTPHPFRLDNDAFTGIDPFVLWGLLRWLRPGRVIEAGSGHSTLLGAQALLANGSGRWKAIDPAPRDFIAAGIPGVELLRRPVEMAELSMASRTFPEELRRAFPRALGWHGGSFWLRKK